MVGRSMPASLSCSQGIGASLLLVADLPLEFPHKVSRALTKYHLLHILTADLTKRLDHQLGLLNRDRQMHLGRQGLLGLRAPAQTQQYQGGYAPQHHRPGCPT